MALIEPVHVKRGSTIDTLTGAQATRSDRCRHATQAFRLLRGLLRHHKRLFFTAVGCAAVYAACTVFSSVVVRLIIDKLIVPRFEDGSVPRQRVVAILGLLVAVGVVRAVGVVGRRMFAGRTSWRVTETLHRARSSTGSSAARAVAPHAAHRRHHHSRRRRRRGRDPGLNPLPFATSVVVMLVLSAVWLLITDIWLGLAAVAVFPLLIGLTSTTSGASTRSTTPPRSELGKLSEAVHESFDGVTVVKSFGAESRETDRLAVIASRLRNARFGAIRLRSTFEALLDGVPTVGQHLPARCRRRTGCAAAT